MFKVLSINKVCSQCLQAAHIDHDAVFMNAEFVSAVICNNNVTANSSGA